MPTNRYTHTKGNKKSMQSNLKQQNRSLLKNAKIYDGTCAPAYIGDILIENDRIVRVEPNITGEDNCTVIDLKGLSIAPGFIDAHSHNDWFAIRKEQTKFFEPFIRQGITTFVTGNCGLSATGFSDESEHKDKIGGGLFSFKDCIEPMGQIKDYLDALDQKVPCNVAVLVGHCTARASVSGNANRELTEQEEAEMLSILENALKQGAAGISLGMVYKPGLYAQKEEIKKVARLCEKYDRPLTVHPRASSAVSMSYPELFGRSHLLRAMDELCEIVKGTKTKLQYSHAIFVGRNSFKDKDEFIAIVDKLQADGVDIMFDIYNETMGVSVISVVLPAWYQSSTDKERKKLRNRLKLSVLVRVASSMLGFGFKDIQIAYIGKGYEKYEGKTVREIAREENMSDLDAYLMLCEISNFKGRVNMGPYSTREIIEQFERDPRCLYMTDAWVEDHGIQNPSVYDCFPKFLRDSILGVGDTLPNTINRMTGASAERFSLKDRGYIRPGCFADLTVFNEGELSEAIPNKERSFGISKVWINGELILDGDELNAKAVNTCGRAIRVI